MVESVQTAQLQWNEDGYPVATQFDDVYFSKLDGLAETRYVFLKNNQLPQRWIQQKQPLFTIGESGFGSGLNFLATWWCWAQLPQEQRPTQLHFISFEKYPLTREDLQQTVAHWPELTPYLAELLDQYPTIFTSGCHRLTFEHGHIILDLWFGDIHESAPQIPQSGNGLMDCWFLDGFAPAKNPDMWNQDLFDHMARLSKNNATLATFTAAGFVRRGLQDAGFTMAKAPGFGRKRDMLIGEIHRFTTQASAPIWYKRPVPSLVQAPVIGIIGGGLAGASLSYALAKRGIKHIVYEQSENRAQGASGNRQGAIYPLLNHDQAAANQFFIHAFDYAKRIIKQLDTSESPIAHDFCGVLQIGHDERSRRKIVRLLDMGWPYELIHGVDPVQTSEHLGQPVKDGGLFYPQAGWASPVQLVDAMFDYALRSGYGQFKSSHQLTQWHDQSDGRIALEFAEKPAQSVDQLVLCNGYQMAELTGAEKLPITPVRGQVSHLAVNAASAPLKTVLCYAGYLTPEYNGSHCLGATHQRFTTHCELDENDTQENLQAIQHCLQQIWCENLKIAPSQGRAGVRATIRDHMPLMGPLIDIEQLITDYPKINTIKLRAQAPELPFFKNVYVLGGLGARGVTTAPLLGELLACELTGAPEPVSQGVLDSIHPSRFWIRRLLRGQEV